MKWPRALIRCCTCTAGVTLGSVQCPALFGHVVALAAAAGVAVFATGGMADDLPASHADRPTLAKPFTIGAVERALEKILGQ